MIKVTQQLNDILKSSEQQPIMRLDIYDTSNTVPSNGWFASYYSGVDKTNPSALKRTQFEPSIFNDYSVGLPVPLSNYIGFSFNPSGIFIGNPYMIVWSGFFFSQNSGNYSFATRAYGGTRIFLNNTDILGGSGWNLNQTKPYYLSGIVNLPANSWTPIEVDFGYFGNATSGTLQPHVTALYAPPLGSETLLTASQVSPSGAFLNPITLTNIMDVKEDRDSNSTQLSFEVPIIQGQNYLWSLGTESFGPIKPSKLMQAYFGYATESGYSQTSGYTTNLTGCSDYVRRFTGFIDSISVAQNYGSLTATVKCRDFNKRLLNALNKNYPNFASYVPSVTKNIDPKGFYKLDSCMPNAYDNWYILDAMNDLLLHADIDPTYINNSLIDIGNYFRLEHNLSWPNTTYIDNYGQQFLNKDPFLFRYPYGNKIYDLITQLTELVGYTFRFDEDGDVFMKDPRYTKRIESYETSGVNSQAVTYSGTYSPYYNPNASNRVFYSNVSGTFGDNDSFTVPGTVAIYNFEQNALDGSSYNFNLTKNGSVPYQSSPIPKQGNYSAGPFSSSNYFISPAGLDLAMGGLASYSVEFYLYPLSTGIIYAFNSGRIEYLPNKGIGFSTNGFDLSTPANAVQLNSWIHIGCTFDGTNKQIFVSGIRAVISGQNGIININPGPQYIGISGVGGPGFSGYIDQFRISDVPRISFPTPENPITITSGNNSINVLFSGVGCSVFYAPNQYGQNAQLSIYSQASNQVVFTTGFNTYLPGNEYGVSQFITNTLPYSGYKASITSSGLFKFEGLEIYDKNIWSPDYTLRANEDIVTVDLEFTDSDLRNEVIVVGQQILGGNNNGSVTANPTMNDRYLYSRAIDLDSIWNPSSSNYTGDERTLVLVEPRLQSQRRVDWLASSLLNRYRKNQRNLTLGLPGKPNLQINDAIGVVSDKIGIDTDRNLTINTSGQLNEDVLDLFYIEKLSSEITQDKYVTNLTVTSLPPIDSWRSYLPPTTLLVTGYVQQFGSIFTDWQQLVTNSSVDPNAYDSLSLTPLFVQFNSFVDLDRLWVFVDDRPMEQKVNYTPVFSDFGMSHLFLSSPNPTNSYTSYQLIYSGFSSGFTLPNAGVFLHNGGGEVWGNLTLPNSMDSDYGGGQFFGQLSDNRTRPPGTYPVAVWGIGTLSDGSPYYTDLWHPPSGSAHTVTIQGLTYPSIKVANPPTTVTVEHDPDGTGNWIKMALDSPFLDVSQLNGPNVSHGGQKARWRFTANHEIYLQTLQIDQLVSLRLFYLDRYFNDNGSPEFIYNPQPPPKQPTQAQLTHTMSSVSSSSPTTIFPGTSIVIDPINEWNVQLINIGVLTEPAGTDMTRIYTQAPNGDWFISDKSGDLNIRVSPPPSTIVQRTKSNHVQFFIRVVEAYSGRALFGFSYQMYV